MIEQSILYATRLPARLATDQAALILGFAPHEISVLLNCKLLKPLGKPAQNGHKFFCTKEILELSENRDWLDKATRAVSKHWQDRNRKSVPEKENTGQVFICSNTTKHPS